MTVLFSDFLTSVASMLGSTSSEAGMFLSMLITVVIILIVVIGARGINVGYTSLAAGVISTLLFTLIGWLPSWTGGAIALALGMIIAIFMARGMGGE